MCKIMCKKKEGFMPTNLAIDDKLIVEAEGWWRTAEPIEDLVKRRRVGRKQRKP